jgi:NADH:ubiquinone oxidoreductase subunit 2 (subunit N)
VSLLVAVAARHRSALLVGRAVAGKVADLVAALARHALGGAGLRAVGSAMARLLAIAAGARIDALLGAVTSTMALLAADDAFDRRTVRRRLLLRLLLLAVLGRMTGFYRDVSIIWPMSGSYLRSCGRS